MTTRQEVLIEARTWIGTPWVHQGRIKGEAIDCVGYPIKVAQHFNFIDWDYTNYAKFPDHKLFVKMCRRWLTPVQRDPIPGDLVLMAVSRHPIHIGFIGDKAKPFSILHAFEPARKVTEHRVNKVWLKSIKMVFEVPWLD